MSPEPFDSRAKAPPAKRLEKGYGNENGVISNHVTGSRKGPINYIDKLKVEIKETFFG